MSIKLNVGASPIWRKDEWLILDHKASRSTDKFIKGDAVNMDIGDGACSAIFCSHVLEHIPNIRIQNVLMEFSRVLQIGGHIRILTPDLKKIAKAYVEDNKEFFKKAREEVESTRTDLGLGGMFMNFVVSPGQDTVLLNRTMTEFIGGYAHIYNYDFEMLEILLSMHGFGEIKMKGFCESDLPEWREPLHVEGMEAKWQNLNKKFYQENGLVHEYKDGKYNINFSVTGFDRDPLISLIIEAKKVRNIKKEDVPDLNGEAASNYNRYAFSLLSDENVRNKLKLLGISV